MGIDRRTMTASDQRAIRALVRLPWLRRAIGLDVQLLAEHEPAGDLYEMIEPSVRTMMERCRPYVDALWLFACFTCGDPVVADRVVVEAVVKVCRDPARTPAAPPWVWSTLVGNVECPRRAVDSAALPAPFPTVSQREAVALVLSGCTPRQVACLVGGSVADVHRALNGGLMALRDHLPSRRPRAPTRLSRVVTGGRSSQ